MMNIRPSPLLAVLALGCAGATIQTPPPAAPTPARTIPDAIAPLAIGCWMAHDFDFELPARDRCTDVLLRAWGTSDDVHRAKLQGVEPDEIGALRARLQDFGVDRTDLAFFDRVARARREAVLARRAAVGEALGLTATPEPCDGLLALFAGRDPRLRAIAYMTALERMDGVRGLPRAIRAAAIGPMFEAFYGIPKPSAQPTAMEWLAFLEAVAATTGHLPAAGDPETREVAAWHTARAAIATDLGLAAELLPASDLRRAALVRAGRVEARPAIRVPIRDAAGDEHSIVLQAAACWLDVAFDSHACATVARTIHGDRTVAYEAQDGLRWAEPGAVDDLVGAVRWAGGPGVDADVVLLRAAGDAAREAQRVRWATADDTFADVLGESKKLEALLANDKTIDARAIGLAFAAERLWIGRPTEDDRVAAPVLAVFGERGNLPLRSEDFDIGEVRPALARAMAGEAIADRLRLLPVGAPLSDVVGSIVLRLDVEYRAALVRYEP